MRDLGIVLVVSGWKLFQVKQQIRGEEVGIRDSQALMSSSISGNRLSSYRLFVLIYSWQQADGVEALLVCGC